MLTNTDDDHIWLSILNFQLFQCGQYKENPNKNTGILVDNHPETYLKEQEAPCHSPWLLHWSLLKEYIINYRTQVK